MYRMHHRKPVRCKDYTEFVKSIAVGIKTRRVRVWHWNGWCVSTVFLNADHGFGGKPIFFETMIIKDGVFLDHQWRDTTHRKALITHRMVKQLVKVGKFNNG